MDYIKSSDFDSVRQGLCDMMQVCTSDDTPDGRFDSIFMDIEFALLVIEIAKRAEDKTKWFPHGKWGTIQSIQAQVDKELDKLRNE